MANPQLEDGYLRVATEIWEALCRLRIPGQARQVLDVVIRKTYGFNKKRDAIAISQIMKLTGLKRGYVVRARDKLLKMNLVGCSIMGTEGTLSYSFNKDYETWVAVPKKEPRSNNGPGRSQKGQKRPNMGTTIYTNNRHLTIDKDIPFDEIVEHLNRVGGRLFEIPVSESVKRFIRGRWNDGARLSDFKAVNEVKAEQWRYSEQKKYLRPSTLYNAEKWPGYLAEARDNGYKPD